MSKGGFFLSFLRDPATVGSVVPSSRFLIQKLVGLLDLSSCRCIVEFGAGEGCVTRYLLRKIKNDCVLLSFELKKELIDRIQCKRENLILIHDDVRNLLQYMKKYHVKKIDYVVSSLPLAQFRKEKSLEILQLVHENLTEEGKFVQYQYSLLSLRKLKKVFPRVDIGFTPLNIPPAFVYTCSKT